MATWSGQTRACRLLLGSSRYGVSASYFSYCLLRCSMRNERDCHCEQWPSMKQCACSTSPRYVHLPGALIAAAARTYVRFVAKFEREHTKKWYRATPLLRGVRRTEECWTMCRCGVCSFVTRGSRVYMRVEDTISNESFVGHCSRNGQFEIAHCCRLATTAATATRHTAISHRLHQPLHTYMRDT